MKTQLFALAAFAVLTATTASAQFASTPLEPGLYDYFKRHNVPGVELLSRTKMRVGGVVAEWISSEQITVTAVVAQLGTMSEESRRVMEGRILEYNTEGAMGTL